jgi:hypothetical protein
MSPIRAYIEGKAIVLDLRLPTAFVFAEQISP